MAATSPNMQIHRRSITGRETATNQQNTMGGLQVRTTPTGTISASHHFSQGRDSSRGVPMPFQPIHLTSQNTSVYSSAGASEASSPRAPLNLLGISNAPSHSHSHSHSQVSPRLSGGPLSAPAKTIGQMGFFSGSDTGMWAPSPHNAQANAMGGLSSSSQSHTRIERFSFDQHNDTLMDPSAAWSVDAEVEKATTSIKSLGIPNNQTYHHTHLVGGGMQSRGTPLLLVDDQPHIEIPTQPVMVPSPPHTATGVQLSPSPDETMPNRVAQSVWHSPQPSGATKDQAILAIWRAQLASHLQCAYAESAVHAHMLDAPVSTACCGVSFCHRCIDSYRLACESVKSPRLDELKFDPNSSDPGVIIGHCQCGRTIRANDIQRLREAPVNKTLHQLTEWANATEATHTTTLHDNTDLTTNGEPPLPPLPAQPEDTMH